MVSGTAFVQQYHRQAGPKAPVVLVSGDRDLRRVASELGVAGYVSKPFEMGDLLTLVRSQTGFSRRPRCASPAI
jgi:DNA-binding NtrC family response regulator